MRKAALLLIFTLSIFIFVGVMMTQSMLVLQRIAGISAAHGTVSIKQRGAQAFQPLAGRERVAAGDTIMTGADSGVDLNWVDGTRIRLAPNTTMTVRSCSVNKANDAETSVFDLGIGKIWVRVLKILSQKSKFEVHTPTATAGVRGTIFSVEVGADGQTHVSVDEGAVAVESGAHKAEVAKCQAAEAGSGNIKAVPMPKSEATQWQQVEDIKGPLLTVSAPTADATFAPGTSVTVAAEVERGAQVTVNGQPTKPDIHGRLSVSLTAPADAKQFAVTVIAKDARGYTTTVTRTLSAQP